MIPYTSQAPSSNSMRTPTGLPSLEEQKGLSAACCSVLGFRNELIKESCSWEGGLKKQGCVAEVGIPWDRDPSSSLSSRQEPSWGKTLSLN